MSADPQFDRYYPYDALTEQLKALAETYPHLLTLDSIGKSFEGRELWCVTATNLATGPAAEKPAFWCDGNIHATEVSASSACLYLLNRLATGHGRKSERGRRNQDGRQNERVPLNRVIPSRSHLCPPSRNSTVTTPTTP